MCVTNQNLFVITGGPGSGKTTVLRELDRRGCEKYRYSPRVFIAPPWKEIYKTDTERKQDFAEAVRTYEQLLQVYQECGYKLLELPLLSPVERADFILNHLE